MLFSSQRTLIPRIVNSTRFDSIRLDSFQSEKNRIHLILILIPFIGGTIYVDYSTCRGTVYISLHLIFVFSNTTPTIGRRNGSQFFLLQI
mmetsp:Transcript_19059/g.22074  ORF Transcript_19059/g.22074 Transcript_19059/m.22074 type:complete len:90 (+) Transcript_19059:160-429(+)